MKLLKNVVSILCITIVLFLAFDFVLSHLGFTPDAKRHNGTSKGIVHPVYHHDLKPNLDIMDVWGPIQYRLCTNAFGFKVSCNNKKIMKKDFDIAFMGDSFTESIGTTYENSFVGMYAQKHPDISVANLGVSSYSPSIYFKKIEFLLNNGFTFKHIVVLPDISDIRDEALWYVLDEKSGTVVDNVNKNISEEASNENMFHRFLMNNFMFTWYINCILYDYFADDETLIKDAIEHPAATWTRNTDAPYFGKNGVFVGMQRNLEYMKNLKQLLDKHNIKMTIAVYPWPTQLFLEDKSHLGMQIWRDFCIKEDCYNFIDINTPFFDAVQKSSKMETIKKYYIRGDVHFNEEGNKLMFESIDAHLKL